MIVGSGRQVQLLKDVGDVLLRGATGDHHPFERSTRWISLKNNSILSERVVQQRDWGVDKVRLTYSARLRDES